MGTILLLLVNQWKRAGIVRPPHWWINRQACEQARRSLTIYYMKNPTRSQLLAFLETKFTNADSEHHDAEKIYDVLHTVLSDYGNENDTIKDWEDLDAAMIETVDSATPIYTNDVIEWFSKGNNYQAVNDAEANIGGLSEAVKDCDIIKAIQQAYYFTLQDACQHQATELIEQCRETF